MGLYFGLEEVVRKKPTTTILQALLRWRVVKVRDCRIPCSQHKLGKSTEKNVSRIGPYKVSLPIVKFTIREMNERDFYTLGKPPDFALRNTKFRVAVGPPYIRPGPAWPWVYWRVAQRVLPL